MEDLCNLFTPKTRTKLNIDDVNNSTEMINNIIGRTKKLVGLFRSSYKLVKALKLKQKELGCSEIKLVQDVVTRLE